MAGIEDDTDNEAAIDTGDDSQQADNSGAAPVAATPDDNSGAAPVVPGGGQQPAGQQHFTPDLNPANVPGNMKRIVSYLLGADAAPLQAIDQVGQQVDPQGQMAPGDRNLIGLDQAGDVAKQWQLLQAHRKAFMAKQSFAHAALIGSPQKPADLNAAIDAANQAEQHIPDGSNVKFSPSQNGVTATVTMPGTSQPQQIPLTVDQFKQYTDVGHDGQWDKLQQASVPATLQRLSQAGAVTGVPYRGAPAGETQRPKTNVGKTPSSLNLSGSDEVPEPAPDTTGYDPQMRTRAARLFPGSLQQQEQWMTAQEQKEAELTNKKDVANIQGTFRVQGNEATGGSRVKAAEVTAAAGVEKSKNYSAAREKSALYNMQAHVAQQEAAGIRNGQTLAMKGLITKKMSGESLTAPEQQVWDKMVTATPEPQQQAPAPQQRPAAPAQPAAQAKPQGGAGGPKKMFNGKLYTKEEYEALK
jgi:hypothetical protein